MGLFGKKKTPLPSEPVVLLEQVAPDGNLQAVVESNDKTVFLYITGPQGSEFGMRSVWVRNLADAPKSLDKNTMQDGVPPMNPAEFMGPAAKLSTLKADDLSVVWLPEGNGVALKEGRDVVAIIPPWSGQNGFSGYASAAQGEGPVAWGLDSDNSLLQRFVRADEYWATWEDGERWGTAQDAILAAYGHAMGKHSRYFAIDGGEWPPKALVSIESNESTILATVGVALRPQPNVEMTTEDYRRVSRIELAVILPKAWDDEALEGFASYLSGMSSFPWEEQTWLGAGHTIPCNAWQDKGFNHALIRQEQRGVEQPDLPAQDGDPVNLLWFIPISDAERTLAETKGSETLFKSLPSDRWRSG